VNLYDYRSDTDAEILTIPQQLLSRSAWNSRSPALQTVTTSLLQELLGAGSAMHSWDARVLETWPLCVTWIRAPKQN
jgi:hypothetical protein